MRILNNVNNFIPHTLNKVIHIVWGSHLRPSALPLYILFIGFSFKNHPVLYAKILFILSKFCNTMKVKYE
jgi:hypothetical protein